MNENTFWETYRPIQNTIDTNASFEGRMFETYGDELAFVKSQPEENVWTLCEEDGVTFISSGFHIVNRLGYFVTAEAYTGEYVTVRLWSDDDFSDDEESE